MSTKNVRTLAQLADAVMDVVAFLTTDRNGPQLERGDLTDPVYVTSVIRDALRNSPAHRGVLYPTRHLRAHLEVGIAKDGLFGRLFVVTGLDIDTYRVDLEPELIEQLRTLDALGEDWVGKFAEAYLHTQYDYGIGEGGRQEWLAHQGHARHWISRVLGEG